MYKTQSKHILIFAAIALVCVLTCTPFASASVAPDPNKTPRMITCSFYGQDGTRMSFNWNTTDYTDSDVWVVQADDGTGFDSAATKKIRGEVHKSLASNADGYIHTAVAEGLSLNTKYLYKVGDAELNAWGDVGSFVTESGKADAFSFIHVSDPQATSWPPYNVYKECLKAATEKFSPRFVVNTGDIVNNSFAGSQPALQQWEWALTGNYEVMKDYPIVAAAGNHEAADYDFFSRFNFDVPRLPTDTDDSAFISGPYYSFNYNNVHFFALNTNDTLGTKDPSAARGLSDRQLNWLKADLEANKDADWIIGMMHKGIYDAGDGCYNTEGTNYDIAYIRQQLAPLFTQYGVDLMLQGHDHIYSRSYPLVASVGDNGEVTQYVDNAQKVTQAYNGENYDFYVEPQGTIYINSGTGSGFKAFKPLNGEQYQPELYEDTGDGTVMYTAVTVDGGTLVVATYVFDGHYNSVLRCNYGIVKPSIGGKVTGETVNPQNPDGGLSAGAIAGIVVGSAAVVAGGVALVTVLTIRKRKIR